MIEKQHRIVEMAKDICRVKLNCNDVCNPISACDALKYAERAVEAGYRKQNEVAREIFAEIDKRLDEMTVVASPNDCFITTFRKTMEKVTAEVEELKKKYTEGTE